MSFAEEVSSCNRFGYICHFLGKSRFLSLLPRLASSSPRLVGKALQVEHLGNHGKLVQIMPGRNDVVV